MTYAIVSWFFDNTFECTAAGKYCNVKGSSSCNSVTVANLITCQCYKLQCVGSATTFKKTFRTDKNDVNTVKKDVVQLNNFWNVPLVRVNLITLRSSSNN